jgi:hypothetical protein
MTNTVPCYGSHNRVGGRLQVSIYGCSISNFRGALRYIGAQKKEARINRLVWGRSHRRDWHLCPCNTPSARNGPVYAGTPNSLTSGKQLTGKVLIFLQSSSSVNRWGVKSHSTPINRILTRTVWGWALSWEIKTTSFGCLTGVQ